MQAQIKGAGDKPVRSGMGHRERISGDLWWGMGGEDKSIGPTSISPLVVLIDLSPLSTCLPLLKATTCVLWLPQSKSAIFFPPGGLLGGS